MIMSAIAAGYGQSTGAEFLALGVHAGDHAIYPDCREEFIDTLRKVIELSDWNPFTVRAPFSDDKKEILEIGLQLEFRWITGRRGRVIKAKKAMRYV